MNIALHCYSAVLWFREQTESIVQSELYHITVKDIPSKS